MNRAKPICLCKAMSNVVRFHPALAALVVMFALFAFGMFCRHVGSTILRTEVGSAVLCTEVGSTILGTEVGSTVKDPLLAVPHFEGPRLAGRGKRTKKNQQPAIPLNNSGVTLTKEQQLAAHECPLINHVMTPSGTAPSRRVTNTSLGMCVGTGGSRRQQQQQ